MPVADPWDIVETELFQRKAPDFLLPHEVDALHRVLAAEPLAGVPALGRPGCLVLQWGKASPLDLLYVVAPDRRTVLLIDIEPRVGSDLVIEQDEPKETKRVLDVLTKAAGWTVARGLWEIIKRVLEIQ